MAKEHPLILQLDNSGDPKRWITYEDAAYYYAKELVSWTPTDSGFTIYGGTNGMTGRQSTMDMNTIIAIKGESAKRNQNRVPTLTNVALFRRDGNKCAYCGQLLKAGQLTRDHVVPRSKGGPDVWTNVVTACGPCNKHKDARTPAQAGMKLLYQPYAPNRAEYLILMNRNILDDQKAFLLGQVSKASRLLVES